MSTVVEFLCHMHFLLHIVATTMTRIITISLTNTATDNEMMIILMITRSSEALNLDPLALFEVDAVVSVCLSLTVLVVIIISGYITQGKHCSRYIIVINTFIYLP